MCGSLLLGRDCKCTNAVNISQWNGVLLHYACVVAYMNAVILIDFVIITQQFVKHVEDVECDLSKRFNAYEPVTRKLGPDYLVLS